MGRPSGHVTARDAPRWLVRDRGTTIARLRRLFGLAGSEKTDDVCGPAPGPDTTPPADDGVAGGDEVAGGDVDPADDRDDGEGTGTDGGDEKKKRKKGHGRMPASAYPDASHIHVPHQKLRTGDACPGCANGKLNPMREPACIVRIFGQAPLAASVSDFLCNLTRSEQPVGISEFS